MNDRVTKLSRYLLGLFRAAAVDVEAQGGGASNGPGRAKRFSRSFTTEKNSGKSKVTIMPNDHTRAYRATTVVRVHTHSGTVPVLSS